MLTTKRPKRTRHASLEFVAPQLQLAGIFFPQSTGNLDPAAMRAYSDWFPGNPEAQADDTMEFDIDLDRTFLESLQTYARSGQSRAGIRVVFDTIDDMLHLKNFSGCNQLLGKVPVDSLPVNILLAFLTITSRIPSEHLPTRRRLLSEVKTKAQQEMSADDFHSVFDRLR